MVLFLVQVKRHVKTKFKGKMRDPVTGRLYEVQMAPEDRTTLTKKLFFMPTVKNAQR